MTELPAAERTFSAARAEDVSSRYEEAAKGYFSRFWSKPDSCKADPIPVRYPEDTAHSFLALRTPEGKLLAAGYLTQFLHRNEVESRLVFHFKDGSVDDDRTVFSQHGVFRLISDHHIQKEPSFPHPTSVLIKASTAR